jgi:hypothetical protein
MLTQRQSWATRYLLRKFNINHRDDVVGTAFGRWAQFEKPQRRAGRPVLNGKTFPVKRDPWRGVSRTAFGLDYLKQYKARECPDTDGNHKMMELNSYDNLENPTYGYDAYVQRLSVYVQRKDDSIYIDPDDVNPYSREFASDEPAPRRTGTLNALGDNYVPLLHSLDNGNTIIVFEWAQSGSVRDALMGARDTTETRWRRLATFPAKEKTPNYDRMALEFMDVILKDIFKTLAYSWESYLNICSTHVSILEDKIYENPADESRAPELWTNSNLWLKVEKLIYIHLDIIKEMRVQMKELVDEPDSHEEWLVGTLDEFEKLENLLQEDLVKPTANLSDLMYKSVGIRDSRHSLQLGTSMWRLSWITFIFLPLTFIVRCHYHHFLASYP